MRKKFYKEAIEIALKEKIALTFDDVRLQSDYSEVKLSEVNVESKFSRNINLKIPIISSAMDTVTEYKLAIRLAELGGVGIIHKSLTSEEQAKHVSRGKHHLNAYIEKPICIFSDESVEEVLNRKNKKGYSFNSFPVLNREGKLVGIVTGNDFEFCDDHSIKINKIMTTSPLHFVGKINIEKAYQKMRQTKKKALPVTDKKGKVIGMYVFSDVKRVLNGNKNDYNVDSKGRLIIGAAIGVYDDAFSRLEKLVRENVDVVVIDTAHGDSKPVYETLKKVKNQYPELDVVVGNVSIGESAKRLANAGADGIKVGQGPGSICTTRIVAGIGRPQLTAVYDCAKAIYGSGIPICADGGLRYSGDMVIAIAAGADSLMMGKMLAGTDESPGELIYLKGRTWKGYRGMGSLGAMQKSAGARQRYFQENVENNKLVPEGIEGRINYKGPLEKVIYQYIGGLKAGMGYVGAKNIRELREKGEFDRITAAGVRESHPHDVEITEEAPNYSVD
ncbi:Inosine-5'-monophosphate dehydrogenase [uncultured archaeon]|nr:Inosine-5'-monophosphate dehydrogenase [uncultured archaeon]